MPSKIAFSSSEILPALGAASNAELDELDFGVIEMDLAGTVLRYNRKESESAGLPIERVVGRNFFQDVAVCCNNQLVAQRFEQSSLDETMDYTFTFQMKLTPVKLRLLKGAGAAVMYMLVMRP
jgi:photoactive yellow protein